LLLWSARPNPALEAETLRKVTRHLWVDRQVPIEIRLIPDEKNVRLWHCEVRELTEPLGTIVE
jgi:hypothetical protein